MKVTFCGATKTVTGSNFLVEGAGKKFLVDCGLYQGGAKDEIKNEEPFPYDINEIDFMLLTHAHIDHSGRIPKLYKEGYRNPIYATNATCDLCAIMLPDSGHIQETETEWKNRKRIRRGEEELVPIYDAETAAKSLELFKGEPYNQIIELDDDIHVRFNDAGHMLGSSTIEIWIRENGENKKIVFSGDLGNNDIPLLAEPTMIQDADFLVMESTYGNRLHIKNESKAETFINIVTDTIKNGGTVVIPSFAVGRTQEILYELNKIKENTFNDIFSKGSLMNTSRNIISGVNSLSELPTELLSFVKDVNRGETKIDIEMANSDKQVDKLEKMLHQLVIGLLDAAVLLGACMVDNKILRAIYIILGTIFTVWLFIQMAKDHFHSGY